MRDAESLLNRSSPSRWPSHRVRRPRGRRTGRRRRHRCIGGRLVASDAPAALDAVASLADAGRDLAQVAAQAEADTRRRLLASTADPVAARRLAAILRTVAEAAGAGAREGRARLMLELLAVEPLPAAPSHPGTQPAPSLPGAPPGPAACATTTEDAAHERAVPRHRRPQSPAAPAVAASSAGLEEIRAGWATVVDRASPVIKPLLKECRPIARDGARLTLAFPEGRDFMRSRISQRAGQIEALLTDMFGGSFAIESVASDLELEPLTVEEAVGDPSDDPEARALLEGVLKITGGELVDAPEVR